MEGLLQHQREAAEGAVEGLQPGLDRTRGSSSRAWAKPSPVRITPPAPLPVLNAINLPGGRPLARDWQAFLSYPTLRSLCF